MQVCSRYNPKRSVWASPGMLECSGSDSRGHEIRDRGQKERWFQTQASLEPMCAAAGPRTNSNQACLSTRPLLHVPQNEDCASCFRRCRAGRLRRPAQVRSPPEYPIHTPHALRPADLRCLRFPAEATLTMNPIHEPRKSVDSVDSC